MLYFKGGYCNSVDNLVGVSPAGQEVIRLRVVAALESGVVRTYRQAAEVFQVGGWLVAGLSGRWVGDSDREANWPSGTARADQ